MITAEYLRSIVSYDPETGVLLSIGGRKRVPDGKVLGCLDHQGYRLIKIAGKMYKAHRLAWLYMTGTFPKEEIDHINHAVDDNRWGNLREATTAENLRHRRWSKKPSSGARGVYPCGKKFRVRISVDGKNRHFGTFEDCELAELVASEVRRKTYKEFTSDVP